MGRNLKAGSVVKSVQRITTGTRGSTNTISAVDVSKTVLWQNCRTGSSDWQNESGACHLTDSTTVTTYGNGSYGTGNGTQYIDIVEYV
jgi:hypothetical protein